MLHVATALCLIAVVIVGTGAHRNWRAEGRGPDHEQDVVKSRVRFLAFLGMTVSGISALLIVAQWLAIFIFGPCQRA